MIKIARTEEPPELLAIREERVAAARQARQAGTKIRFEDYDRVKPQLAAMQSNKCCYCEKREEQAKYRDVEHYRPKAPYWWLAWTWRNLLFSCMDCNREQKRDQFPLAPGSPRLAQEQSPPGLEAPLVLDPSDEAVDPLDEIESRQERVQGLERWVPRPRAGSVRGRETIRVCGLERPTLLTLYADHVTYRVRPRLAGVHSAIRRDDPRAVLQIWRSATRALLSVGQPFRALSFDALAVLVPLPVRQQYGLTLERP